jgi:dipeptidase E
MKLLLTSGGLRNEVIIKALRELVDKPFSELKVAFIPTALNVESGDKDWAVAQMVRIQQLGVKQLDIVDPSAVDKEIWLPRLEESDVIFVNGGSTTHLMTCFNESGLTEELPKLLKSRIYIGVSAGSYITTPDIRFNADNTDKVLDGLNFVDFGLQVHYKNPDFLVAKSYEAAQKRVEGCPYVVYALDDQMAVKVDGNNIEIVGEGEHVVFEPNE